jgi:hypothetical protein
MNIHMPTIGSRAAFVGAACALAVAVAALPTAAMPLTSVRQTSTVTVTVPPIVTGDTDSVPAVVAHGRSYAIALRVMATAGTGGATVNVTATGATMSACSLKVAEIKVYTLKCPLRVNATATKVVVDLSAKGKGFSAKYVSFTHAAK